MNRKFVALAGVAVAGLSSAAFADGQLRVDYASNANYNGGGGGGGFQVTPHNGGYIGQLGGNGGDSNSFVTFCIEEGETFSPGHQWYFGHITTAAVSGQASPGSGWDPVTNTDAAVGSDPISSTTALIYRTFRDGGDFGGAITGAADTVAENAAIQRAIWFAEGEIYNHNEAGFRADSGLNLAEVIYDWARTNNNGSLYGVRVLQLWDSYSNGVGTGNHQDMLTIIPLPPAAYAGIGSLLGVLGFGVIRRRRLRAE